MNLLSKRLSGHYEGPAMARTPPPKRPATRPDNRPARQPPRDGRREGPRPARTHRDESQRRPPAAERRPPAAERPPLAPGERGEVKVYGANACLALWRNRAADIVRLYVAEDRVKDFGALLKWCASQKRAYHVVSDSD